MRRRRKHDIGGFSASALDLFASALGAFIVITVLLFPYFPNLSPDPLLNIIEALRGENATLSTDLDDQRDENTDLTAQNDSLQTQLADLADLRAQLDTARADLATSQADLTAAQADAATSQSDLAAAQADLAAAEAATDAAQNALSLAQSQGGDLEDRIAALEAELDGVAFIGIEPDGRDFQLVLDMSGSITDHADKVQAISAIIFERINAGKRIRIITYRGDVSAPIYNFWPSRSTFRGDLTASDIAAARAFVRSELANATGGTPSFQAAALALSETQNTSIILVTDGLPQITDGEFATRAQISREISSATTRNNRRHQINIIATGQFTDPTIGEAEAARALAFGLLATRNNGALVAIP